jgi:hypothetical protein
MIAGRDLSHEAIFAFLGQNQLHDNDRDKRFLTERRVDSPRAIEEHHACSGRALRAKRRRRREAVPL